MNKGTHNKALRGLLYSIYGLCFAWTIILVLVFSIIWHVYTAKQFQFENCFFLLMGLCSVFLLFAVNARYGVRIETFLQKHFRWLLVVSLLLLLLWQLYAGYGGYFQTGWDAGRIRKTVYCVICQKYNQINHAYFSWFPNNVFLVWVYKTVVQTASVFGIHNWEYALVAFQCVIDVITVWLVYVVAWDFSKSQRLAWVAYLTAFLFVGLSPWFFVPYSDATGIVFPVLLLRLYQLWRKTDKKRVALFWSVLFGIVSMAGYHIKPQTVIVSIAVVLSESLGLCSSVHSKRRSRFLTSIICAAAGMAIVYGCLNLFIVPSLQLRLETDKTIGWQHFLMMGLNDKTDGAYLLEDYQFTRSFISNEERNHADLKEAQNRIRTYGAKGLLRHLSRKQLVNYGDGTFAWGREGHFFNGDPEWAQNSISSLIRSLIKPDGEYYALFISSKQVIWVMVLFFQLFVPAINKKRSEYDDEGMLPVFVMSVLGLTVFELVFEARARYLFCYAPIYVILCACGIRNLYRLVHVFPGCRLKKGSEKM